MSVEGPNAAKAQGRYLRANGDGFFVSLVRCQFFTIPLSHLTDKFSGAAYVPFAVRCLQEHYLEMT